MSTFQNTVIAKEVPGVNFRVDDMMEDTFLMGLICVFCACFKKNFFNFSGTVHLESIIN